MPRRITRQEALQDALARFHRSMPQIRMSVIANNDGLLVAAYPVNVTDSGDDDALAATTAVIMALAEQSLDRTDLGEPLRVILEGLDGVAVLYQCTNDSVLTVLSDNGVKMGVLSSAVRRTSAEIRDILDIRDY